jgi:hypothetical protein
VRQNKWPVFSSEDQPESLVLMLEDREFCVEFIDIFCFKRPIIVRLYHNSFSNATQRRYEKGRNVLVILDTKPNFYTKLY